MTTPGQLDSDKRAALLDDVRAALAASESSQDEAMAAEDGADLAALLAVPVYLGGQAIPPLTLGGLAVLEYLRNPLVTGQKEYALLDLWEFLYVCFHAQGEITQVYEFARAKRALDDSREIAAKSPEHYAQYLAAVDKLTSRHFAEWEARLQAFSEQFRGVHTADVLAVVETLIGEATRSAQAPPSSPGDGKKNAGPARPTGIFRRWTRWLANMAGQPPKS